MGQSLDETFRRDLLGDRTGFGFGLELWLGLELGLVFGLKVKIRNNVKAASGNENDL